MPFEKSFDSEDDAMTPKEPGSALTPEIRAGWWMGGGRETGRMFEARLLGEFVTTRAFIDEEAHLPRRGKRYRSDDDLYDLIVKHYTATGDPENPPTEFGTDIRVAISDALGLGPDDEKNLRFYTAVGTPADYKMGVDAFVEYTDVKTGRKSRATIDVTKNKRKIMEGDAKADVTIGELPDAVQEADDYLDVVDEYGHQIAIVLTRASKDRRVA